MVSNAAIVDQQSEFEATAYHPVESELGTVIDIERLQLLVRAETGSVQ